MITKEDAENLENEDPIQLVDMLCVQSELIDKLKKRIKDKNESIFEFNDKLEQCKIRNDNLISDIYCIQELNRKYKKQAQKSRSIVAMLFWELKKDERVYKNANKYTKNTAELYCNCSAYSFQKAYAMIKDNK